MNHEEHKKNGPTGTKVQGGPFFVVRQSESRFFWFLTKRSEQRLGWPPPCGEYLLSSSLPHLLP